MIDHYVLQEQLKSEMKGFPVKQLFKNGRTLSTLMFWISFFMCLFVMYGYSTWLPKIMGGAGYELDSSLTFLVVLNLGAVFGAIVGGKLADRYGSRILVTFLVIGFITLTMLSFKPNMIMLYILICHCRRYDNRYTNRNECICILVLSKWNPFYRCRHWVSAELAICFIQDNFSNMTANRQEKKLI
ncbi:MFS transporter [Peribacillus sp. V2I11]|uniref:MFS transporter n=1 Tax=Peribacillus sp. V2I11 TaxID=3042277 RepID=UPI0027D83175|nr:MFS transporter [Peribacillus sp. V2I11]